ncbi:DUF6338 family protein [Tomitella cavernea]|uniref:DUF6338 family protein n=1 Tax=Tomitella cavernea TaxID=1387982 RepID=UPI001906B6DF|nr:DUF6338 family protein [Tomitella cavernea]
MPTTINALVILVVSVLPGILFTLGYEREYTRIASIGFHERAAIFVGMSALFGVVSLPAIYQGYRVYVHTGEVRNGAPLPWWLWFVVIGYVFVPLAAGFGMGVAASRQSRLARPLTGPHPHPRAWDALFQGAHTGGYLKLLLKDPALENRWVMGAWALKPRNGGRGARSGSYAAAYPYE